MNFSLGEVGFLKEDRRLNVAVTRARRHLFVVGDTATISRHPFLESFSSYMFENAMVRSPLLHRDGAVSTEDTNIGSTSSAIIKHIPNLSRFELPAVEISPSSSSNINSAKITQQKKNSGSHEQEKKFIKEDFDAEGKQNQVCSYNS